MDAIRHDDAMSITKHNTLLNVPNKEEIEIVFFGDSLTRRWEDNKDLWDQFFSKYNCANFGVGGDTLENMKWRIENNELDDINPKLVVALMGTNNITDSSAEYIGDGISELSHMIHVRCPSSKILLLALFPREKDENGNDCNAKITSVNNMIRKRIREDYVLHADFGSHLLSPDGTIDKNIMPDGLHLNHDGYKVLGPLLTKSIEQIVG